jgi:hypothetical protein
MSKPKQTDDKVIEELADEIFCFTCNGRAATFKQFKEQYPTDANRYYEAAKAVFAKLRSLGYEKVDRVAIEIDEEVVIKHLSEWIAIEHDETRFQGNKYLEEAQGLRDLLTVIGLRSPSEIRAIERAAVERVFKEFEKKATAFYLKPGYGDHPLLTDIFDKVRERHISEIDYQALKSSLGEQDKGG